MHCRLRRHCRESADSAPGAPHHAAMADPAVSDPLTAFQPGIRRWFDETFGTPTSVQAAAWPVIAAGDHVLATAPTGSGKTLTAFLWALNRFAAGDSAPGHTRVLYVSPLKALNNDIRRNLLGPLAALEARGAVPTLRVETRSGDTPQGDRQRMLRRPPEILVTTPESLLLLLSGTRGRHALAGVETVIVDEVHALVDNRRGTLLLVALERLAELAGDFQRIALSATVRPLDAIAAFVAGRDADGRPRPIRTLAAGADKRIELSVRFPDAVRGSADAGEKIWEPMAAEFRRIIAGNRATLFFANSRRLAERLTLAINRDQPAPLAYAHHGSLAREVRLEVEARLKQGELKAIVATSSLEMGIDIGELDEVVLIQSPPGIGASLQRIGRAGHGVGEISRASLFPSFAQDFVTAAALADAVRDRDIEPLTPLVNPLDVLAQVIIALTATEPWPVDALYALLRRSGSFAELPRASFDLVVEMLAGRYAGARVRELQARIDYDRVRGQIRARHGAVLAYYHSGGVIPNRGYYQIRDADSHAAIGELDEEFVWEATVGQVFALGTRHWQIHRITHNDVLVRPTERAATTPPFWRAETVSRGFHFSRRVSAFLQEADALLAAGDGDVLHGRLMAERGFDAGAAAALTDYLTRQRAETGKPLPSHAHLLLERVLSGPGGYRSPDHLEQLVVHDVWGGRVNRPWALALGEALTREGIAAELHSDDNAVVIQTRDPIDPDVVLRLVTPANLDTLLRASLEGSRVFGARFREAAGRALLLTRQRFNARLPLWMTRLQAKQLMAAVAGYRDFPLLLDAWRTCLVEDFDLPALRECLAGLTDGTTAVSHCTSATPSPFAAHLTFNQINRYMYATDRPDVRGPSALSDELIRGALGSGALRPRLKTETVREFVARRQRTAPGYAPDSADDWAQWVKERVLLPEVEAEAVPTHEDLAMLTVDGRRWLCHAESLGALIGSGLAGSAQPSRSPPPVDDPRSAVELALEVLSFYGPLTPAQVGELLPTVPDGLLDDDALIRGPLLADDEQEYLCDAVNLEALLRLQRARARSTLAARPVTDLAGYLAAWHGFGTDAALADVLEPLRGLRAPVAVWLYDIIAARRPGSADHEADAAVTELGFHWRGAGEGHVVLGFPEDLELLDFAAPSQTDERDALTPLFLDPDAGYAFLQLADRQPAPLSEFNERWWRAVWLGAVAADSLAPLRQGVTRRYALPAPRPGRRARARGLEAWPGTWRRQAPPAPASDPITDLEDAKERVRLLLDRYGLVCRELANREGGSLRWAGLFRALRVMELSGEVVAGHFFAGLSSPQFAAPQALTLLEDATAVPECFWINATDPVSPCGLGLDWPDLPQRRPQHYLAFHRGALALVAENLGRRLTVRMPPDHAELTTVLALLRFLLARHRRLTIDSVNGVPLAESPYRAALAAVGTVVTDHRASYLQAVVGV
jgi:ATP-dependent helicase Lhr and Lhr-like helicase